MRKRIHFFVILLLAFTMAKAAQPLDKVVAIVNDNVITASELNAQIELLRQQLMAKKTQIPPDAVLRKQVLQHLIDVDLQLQLAKKNNMTIDDSELDQTIGNIAQSNKLSLTQLREALDHQGMTWEAYRENIRKEMLIHRVQQTAVGKDITITPEQVADYLRTAEHTQNTNQTFHLQNIVIPLPEEPTTAQVNQAKEKALTLLAKIKQGEDFDRMAIAESSGEYALDGGDLGDRHLAELPEVFAERVVKMKVGEVSDPIRTGNGFQLIKLVNIGGNSDQHMVVKTHVRHILLKQDTNMTSIEATRQINNIYEQLKSGKDFGLMAKQYSLDTASAVKGGDLGWVTADELVPSFAEAMNALPINVISKPVKSPFGWHLIQVLARKTADDSKSFQQQQVRQFLHQRKFNEAVQDWQQHIRADAYVHIVEKELA